MRNILEETCRENQNTFYGQELFFKDNRAYFDHMFLHPRCASYSNWKMKKLI